mgnify:CR=1 FL=1
MENETIKITYAKNLSKLNFNSLISIPVNSNVNIKTILSVQSHVSNCKVECGSGKAIISGKIAVKVLYVDTDNLTNTLTDTQTFNETLLDSSIVSDSYINVCNNCVACKILSTNGTLKISADVSIVPIMYVNLAINNSASNYENMQMKKSLINTSTLSSLVSTTFEHTCILETKHQINKILCYNCWFDKEDVTAFDGYAVVDGKLYSQLIYETVENEQTSVKEIFSSSTLKCDVEIKELAKDCMLDLCFNCTAPQENITTELEDGNSVVNITHILFANGVALKPISIDIIDDMFSTENNLEITLTKRDFTLSQTCQHFKDSVSGDIQLNETEPAIDEIVATLTPQAEITNQYLKDENLWVEGIVSAQVVYLNENKELSTKQVELPFVLNSKISLQKLGCLHLQATVASTRTKVKRGTILDLDFGVCFAVCLYNTQELEMIDTISIGKPLNNSAYDFQIFLAKPNETMWELCKRIKISPENLQALNPNLPLVMQGGEKVIIKR